MRQINVPHYVHLCPGCKKGSLVKRISLLAVLLLSASAGFGQTGFGHYHWNHSRTNAELLSQMLPSRQESGQRDKSIRPPAPIPETTPSRSCRSANTNSTVTVPGFKTYTHTKFHLAAGQTLREDVTLQVGQSTESVTVSAETSLLQTESAEVVGNFTLKQLDDLPLLTVGATNDGVRDYFSASRLLPGVQYCDSATCPAGGSGNAVTVTVINGTPNNSLTTRLDGATMNPTSSRLGGATMETQSSSEAVQEVDILTSSFAPEFGAGLGAVVNVVTKSGTNDLHGTVYDYLVNNALNAAPALPGNEERDSPERLRLHRRRSRLDSQSLQRQEQDILLLQLRRVPPESAQYHHAVHGTHAAYRNGDFSSLITTENRLVSTASGPYVDPLGRNIPSGTIFDPADTTITVNGQLVRNPFPGNRIPVPAGSIRSPSKSSRWFRSRWVRMPGRRIATIWRRTTEAADPMSRPSRSIRIWAPSCTWRSTSRRPTPSRPGPVTGADRFAG